LKKFHLFDSISRSNSEAELVHNFINHFNLPFCDKNRIDLFTQQILFEFKLDDNLFNLQIRSKVIAQALYYVRRLQLDDFSSPSDNICVVTKNLAVFFPTQTFSAFFNDNSSFDWDLKPSLPCKKLVAALADFEPVIHAHIYDFSNYHEQLAFETLINNTRDRKIPLFNQKKEITRHNFFNVFQYWQSFFGKDVANGHKPSEYFILDIENCKSFLVDNFGVIFSMNNEQIVKKIINPDAYNYFWSKYAKITRASEIIAIRQKMDVMTEINLRRFTGEFYTPIDFAKKAFDYLTRTVGKWWNSDNFRLWDMAAGTGNLEFAIPPDALKFCYISTLNDDEANYCKTTFEDATAFQFDFLNDSADKLPKNLKNDLNNPNLRWIIFINPPYATANNYERDKTKISKDNVSMTAIRKLMTEENLGEVSRELFSQFIYRISKDFSNKIAYLGIFSKIKYINSTNDQKFRDKIFKYKFERGFIFNSKNFDGCKAQFPVGFIVWNLSERISLEEQEISLDIYDSEVEKVAKKIFYIANPVESLNKWIDRPRNVKKFPPMSSALKIAYNNKDKNDKIAENFLAGFMIKGNDFLNQNSTALLSAPYASHAGFSITPENFEQAMIVHMVRRLPKATWLNDRDQFLKPNKPLSREFIADAVIWSLFSASNQTASLKNVEYEGKIYQIRNNFYPFLLEEVQKWECTSPEIGKRLAMATEDRFAAIWLKKHGEELSEEAKSVLNEGRKIYQMFYLGIANMINIKAYKIEDWDVGWYQIRMIMKDIVNNSSLKVAFQKLSAKLEPQIYELGFLRDKVIEA